ncbi:translation initiation factor IF-3, mitochondrial isoform X2 [Varanus komodoensis]|uniref:translation initiation factor IF-3, mitochondrial isoform X2 n=1 Tax=Varanus komodoensis TaxID=61221 RepID=UPI001CF7E3BE|nr:translation initiation factor IF-3, mitochondrial isoform X2 [Varanus komodoensis]
MPFSPATLLPQNIPRMANLCLKKLLEQAGRKDTNYFTRCFASYLVPPLQRTSLSQMGLTRQHAKKEPLLVPTQAFATDEGAKLTGMKINHNAKKPFENVGRKIPHQIIHLIDENGNNQGTMHRSDVIQILEERGMKLVLMNQKADPPVYRLMTGQQIHEERMKLREKQKADPRGGPVQQKQVVLSTEIAQHDLSTKIKQIQQWIDKRHHVKIILQQRKTTDGPEKMFALFDQILDTMPGKATYLSQPCIIKEGRSKCALRHMSDKEIQVYKKKQKDKEVHQDDKKDVLDSDALNQ